MSNIAPSNPAGPKLAHLVFFSLHEPVVENKRKMLAACQELLTGHQGMLHFSVAECSDYARPVNDRDYDFLLMLVFDSHAAHDAYQGSPRHKQFIAQCSALWKKVRVFDAALLS